MTSQVAFADAPQTVFTVPTIEVTGKATREQLPTSGRMGATITGTSQVREEAWENFQQRLAALRDALGDNAELGNAVPDESQEEATKMFRPVTEYTVSAVVEVTFAPTKFGAVIAALVECDLPYSMPDFTFDKLPAVTPELLTAAAAEAKINAEAIAAGVGAVIGRLVAINVGAPKYKPTKRGLRWFFNDSPTFNFTSHFASRPLVNWDIDEEKFETHDTEVLVTVEYEVIEVAR